VSYKILLADDSVTVQKIITLTFSDEGVDVITVNDGDEAISRLQYLRPALVMADVSIPGRNGYEICEFVKIHPEMKETPVILLVPAFEPFDEERARRIGADYHLTKPFQSIRTLISTVKNLMERKADDEFSVKGSGLTAVREPDRNNSAPTEVDSKRAKIEELIRISAEPASENGAEDEALLEVDLAQGDGRYSDSLAIASAPDVVEVDLVEVDLVEVIDVARDAAMDMDILELEDVLPDATFRPVVVVDQGTVAQAQPPTSARPFEKQSEKQEVMIIPQSAIDEIVDRVSAQLSAALSEKLSGEIARRIAPEVAEMVRHQLLPEPAAYRNSDNLLDLD